MRTNILSLAAALTLTVSANVATAQTGDEIIKKHIDAIGGEKTWSKVTSMKMIGAMSMQGMELPMTITSVHGKAARIDISAMGMDGYFIVTPTEGWMYMPIQGIDKVTALTPDQLQQNKANLNLKNMFLVEKSQVKDAKFSGRDTLDNLPCLKVAMKDKEGEEETAYFDAKTYYMVRIEKKMTVKDEEQEVAMNFSDFHKQDGVVIPFTQSSPMGGDIIYKTVEINKPISDDVFKPTEPKPDATKK
jgi:hypothetical protein